MTIQSIPHGWYSIVPTVLTTSGWILGLFQDGCDFVRVQGEIVEQIASQPNAPYLEAGRNAYREPRYNAKTDSWHVEYIGQCLVYPKEEVEIDMWWNVAKGFDFASLVLGGTCSLFLWFSSCCVFSRGTWRLAGFQVLLACFFQSASFLWFRTELCQANDCSLFWGSKSDIAACTVWFLAAVMIFCHYPIPKDQLITSNDGDGLVLETGQSEWYDEGVGDDHGGSPYDTTTATPRPNDDDYESPITTPEDQQQQKTKEEHWLQFEEMSGGESSSSQAGQYSGENPRQQDERPSPSTTTTTPARIV